MQSLLQIESPSMVSHARGKSSWFRSRQTAARTYMAFHAALLSAIVVFLSVPSLSAQPAIQWDKGIGGPVGTSLGYGQPTADGGYILGGTSSSTKASDKSDVGNGWYDYWVVKLNANGEKQWDNAYGGAVDDLFSTMQQTADGGYILAGQSISGIGGDKSEAFRGTYDLDQNIFEFDLWIIKIRADGTKEWDKSLGGTENETVNSIIQTADGGYILSGTSDSGAGFDKTSEARGFWIVKLAANGEKQWDQSYINTPYAANCVIKQTADGGYILGGTVGLWPNLDYKVIRTSSDGTPYWEKTFIADGEDYLATVLTSNDGGYLIGGRSNSNAGGDKSEGAQVSPLADYLRFSDYWVIKLSGDGSKEWDRTFGGKIFDSGGYYSGESLLTSACQTSEGGFLLMGHSNTLAGRSKSEDRKGGYDFWMVNIDAQGNKLWDKTIGGSSGENTRSVFQTTDGGFFLAGNSASNKSFDKSEDKKGTSGSNYWVVKLAPEQPEVSETSVRIKAGGPAYTASGARQFIADKYYAGIERTSGIDEGDILNTTDDVLYRSGRCSPSFSYNIPMANGKVNVILHFAETWYGIPGRGAVGTGKRQFNVTIENSRKLTNFDIFAAAGGAMRAIQASFPVTVSDGMLNIDFTSGAADMPRVSAIEVIRTSLTVQPVADAYTRAGIYSEMNYGSDTILYVKKPQGTLNQQRNTYIRFEMNTAVKVSTARLRVYGYNRENTNKIYVHASGLDDDNWDENTITKDTAPYATNPTLSAAGITDVKQYYEFDVTSYVQAQLAAGDPKVSFFLSDRHGRNTGVVFNSRENSSNPPQLIVQVTPVSNSTARLSQEEIRSAPGSEPGQSLVYPNPVGKRFRVQVSGQHSDDVALHLVNKSGQQYRVATARKATPGQTADVDLSALSLNAGIYLLQIKSGAATEIIQLLVAQ